MKVKFSREVKFRPTWNGNLNLPEAEQISATLKPLVLDDLLLLMDAMGGQDKLDGTQVKKMMKEVGSLLPQYISNFAGLEDDDGPVDVAGIVLYPRYLDLAAEMLMKLAAISTPGEAAEGNSNGQPA